MLIDFSSLRLLHLTEYLKPKGEQCPLDQFRKTINPIEISTCMRHLYLFTTQQVEPHGEHYNQTLLKLKQPRLHEKLPQIDALEGIEAYQFLLFWVIGGLNKKKPFNDERILGDLRKICRSYEVSPSSSKRETWKQNQATMQALLVDAKYLLRETKQIELAIEEKKKNLNKACYHCAWAREQGFFEITPSIDYSCFLDEKRMITHLYERLEASRKKTKAELDKIDPDKTSICFIFSESASHLQSKITQIEKLQTLLVQKEPSLTVAQDESNIGTITI
ncbi:Uncharacterised protein [Legionella steigerwaltii]|uniref:Uncharacterized protein n=1 Tax=Legionella steigerwaltii TaxID=460 RepID=A0A378LA68_9GAMM|nr:hypothetical protein [Legionella steigerwaltii]KTD77502.1 hypothetical protein Lstg_1859 [Legionella steigerwaltii]STY22812.1 Uncharacterised protein [Legionella steigerwaltii]